MTTAANRKQTLAQLAHKHYDYMVDVRRHLHRNPEVSYHEFDTTEFIIGELEPLGFRIERPLETGCVAIIENGGGNNGDGNNGDGNNSADPAENSTRVVALRADIDALAMEERGQAKQSFLSEREGAAHCCGHDAHTANLLGTARILHDLRDHIHGKIVLIFQPGEEKLPGGGRLLCETGLLQKEGVREIFGLHTSPLYAPGQVAVKNGPLMARPDEFEIQLIGKGGHAASPHETIDPMMMLAQVITQFQTIVSRSMDPVEPAVVTIGKVRGGTAHNVIPDLVELTGTVRTFQREHAELIRTRMEQILKGIAEGSGGHYTFQYTEGYPAVINTPASSDRVRRAVRELLGEEALVEIPKAKMAGEDFSFYLQEFPGTFFYLGTGSDEADSRWSWHHPNYNVDERAFLTGATVMAGVALDPEAGVGS
jgi:amidohydrolase